MNGCSVNFHGRSEMIQGTIWNIWSGGGFGGWGFGHDTRNNWCRFMRGGYTLLRLARLYQAPQLNQRIFQIEIFA